MFITRGGDCVQFLREFFAARDYRMLHYVTPIDLATNYRGDPTNAYEGIASSDMLCVPNEKATATGFVDAAIAGFAGIGIDDWQRGRVTRI